MLKRLREIKDRDSRRIVAFLRDKGVICYETPMFEPSEAESISQLLLSSGLSWIWQSAPLAAGPPVAPSTPERPITALTPDTTTSLIADLQEQDLDENRRTMMLYGCDPDSSGLLFDPASFRSVLYDFAIYERGPVRLLVFQVGDSAFEYVFTPHHPVESVVNLLRHWKITEDNVGKTRSYKGLHSIKLESLIGLENDNSC